MNAVKNCLVVLAAAATLASCSADPTKDLAGKDLTLQVTPRSIATRVGDTVEVFASAQDALGGAANGTFTLSGNGGPNFTAAIDTSYKPVYAGSRPQTRTRIVVIALQISNDSLVITGTGGRAAIQIRVAPDSAGAPIAFTSASVTLGNQDTATAPAGTRFTHGTTISIATPGLAAAAVKGMSADSTKVYFLPGPGASGKATITGIANLATPTLVYTVTTADTIHVPGFSNFAATHSQAALAGNAVDTITAGAGWKFTPASGVTSHGMNGIVLGISADSSQLFVKPTPDTTGALSVSGLITAFYPALRLTLPTSTSVAVGSAPDLGGDDPFAGPAVYSLNMGAGDVQDGFWDQLTFQNNGADNALGDGDEQWYIVNVTEAGDVTFTADWTGGGDLDMFIVDGTFSSILSQDGATTAHPESATITGSAANTSYYVGITNSSGTVAGTLGFTVGVVTP